MAGALDFFVEVIPLGDSLNGDCHHGLRRIRVNADVFPKQGVKTLVHELAHALLHGPSDTAAEMPRALKELEAESVAYMVCSELGRWGRGCLEGDLRLRTADPAGGPRHSGRARADGSPGAGGGGLMAPFCCPR